MNQNTSDLPTILRPIGKSHAFCTRNLKECSNVPQFAMRIEMHIV